MDTEEFWSLIEESRRGREDDLNAQEDALKELLRGRSKDDLVGFERLYREQHTRAYSWDVWGAGYVIAGGMSDDSFSDFREWLISRGREIFERTLADPDSLADAPNATEETIEAEGFGYVANTVYREEHGEDLPSSLPPRDYDQAPSGRDWDDDDLPERFPRLWAKATWHD